MGAGPLIAASFRLKDALPPARAPPLSERDPDQAGWDDDTAVFTSCS